MSTLRVIFVHGISDVIIDYDYSSVLAQKIIQNLKDLGVLNSNSSVEDINKVITFENVNYSSIGQKEEDNLLVAYSNDTSKLYNPIDKFIENLGFYRLREQMISSISDVLVYESRYWREQIRSLLRDKIKPYVGTNDPVTIIGHSLGSVVSFDTLYYNCKDNKDWRNKDFQVQNLFTFGSPIALFSLELADKSGEQKIRYIPKRLANFAKNLLKDEDDIKIIRPDGVWYNYLDAQDLIAYPLETLFENKFPVKDFLVQTGTFPIKSHVAYWQNEYIAKSIASVLRKDYEMYNQ